MAEIDRLEKGITLLSTASYDDLLNVSKLTEIIGNIGLFYDNRHYPGSNGISLYGDDAKYMLSNIQDSNKHGLWQTPSQFAAFLIAISCKNIKTYLDLGCFTGWTSTVVAAYLKRFELIMMDAYDVHPWCAETVQALWVKYNLPINYVVSPNDTRNQLRQHYDLIFIDANHEYHAVKKDYIMFQSRARLIAFHDINDIFCTDVVRFWEEEKENINKGKGTINEYIDHPNAFKLMGIGLIEY